MSRHAEQIWEILQRGTILENPPITVSVGQDCSANDETISEWSSLHSRDYVNAMVFNQAGEAMILEGLKQDTDGPNWHVVGGYLENNEDPMAAVQRELLEVTGYCTDDWIYLGSYITDARQSIGVGHFFCARGVQRIAHPITIAKKSVEVKWVSLRDLRYALLDGRITVLSYAINIALAMLMLFPPEQ